MTDSSYDMSKSDILYARAKKVIPGGIFGHYGYFVRESGPKFFSKSEGSHFWDVDGNEYIDFMCAYGPMILGYNHPDVDAAALNQLKAGNTVSLASPVMVELAETLVDTVDAADWALFSKNGGDGTALSALVARAATGRQKLIKVVDGYHGVAAWMQGQENPGVTPTDRAHVIEIPWNDIGALQHAIDQHPGDIAGFISSPYDHTVLTDNTLPAEGYWQQVESICRKNGIVIIVDDVRTGFRINLKGSNVEYGFTPDLICFGKALANGYPIAALTGSDALKQSAQDVYFTGTQFFNAAPMAAAQATLLELQKIDAVERMNDFGNKWKDGLTRVAASHQYDIVVSGIPAMPYLRLSNVPRKAHIAWIDECVKRGVYMLGYHNHFISTAHTEDDLTRALEIVDDAFTALGPPSEQVATSQSG
jgi:glutamate-1-semialdehyde 2,1-aminomutase